MAELKISLTGEDFGKLVARKDTKINISPIVFAVGVEFMKTVDIIVVTISPDVSAEIMKHYIKEGMRNEKDES